MDRKVQVGITADASQAKREFQQTGAAAKDMSRTVAQAGGDAAASIDKMGDGAAASAQKIDRATGSIIGSIKRATAAAQAGGSGTAAYFEALANQRGLNGDALKPYIDGLRQAERAQEAARVSLGGVGMSAAQTAAALRNVPAQMTDIVVSLSSGQQPMTVLLQQGGQLKDVFGGTGNAIKAVGSYIAGMITPMTAVAAVVAGVGYAFYSASNEVDEFQKNLILTGNAGGLSVEKFNDMTRAMRDFSGVTRGAAAEAITAMSASVNISSESMQRLATTAAQLQRAGGPAIDDTVKKFEALGKDPLKASIDLDKQLHYLTLTVYEQISALERQGKVSDAAVVAQNALADALDQRVPQMVDNLGYLERAWDTLRKGIERTTDDIKNFGRDETPAEKAAKLHARIGNLEGRIADPSSYYERGYLQQQKQQLVAELQSLYVDIRKAHKEESEKLAKQAKEDAAKAANISVDQLIDSQRSKRQKYDEELKKIDEQYSKELISKEKYQQAKAALAKKYEEKPKTDKAENAYNTLLDSLNKQLGTSEKLTAVEKLNVELQERKYAKLLPSQKEYLRLIAEQIDVQKRAEEEGRATLKWIADGADAQKKAVKSLNDELAKVARDVATYGMSRGDVAEYDLKLLDQQIDAERELNAEIGVRSSEQLRQLEAQRVARAAILDQARQLDQLDAGKKAAEDAAKAAAKVEAEWIKAIDRIDQAFHDGFVKALEASGNSWEAFTDSLRTSLKAAIADGLYQLTMKPLVVSVMTSFAGAAGAAAAADGSKPVASLSNGFGVLTGLQGLWSGINGGISGAATSFAMSGMGQAAGLSTTAAMGPPTAAGVMGGPATVMTGAGTAFAAAAAPVLGALVATYAVAEMNKSGWGAENNAQGYAKMQFLQGGIGTAVIADRLFGHNRNISNDAQGITGTFDLSGFTGQSFQEKSQKGGTFRSDKRWTDYSAIGSDMDKALDSMLKQAVSGVQTIGKALGVEAGNALDGFSHNFRLQLSENGDMSKAGEKLSAELKKVQDELATRLVPNIADFARYGESASDTFSRLNQEVAATDAILLAMGKNASEAFGAVGLASISARESLIDLAGGLDKLASKTQAYYQAYYSSNEQLQLAAKQAQQVLVTGFADIGKAVPANREAFRALVESQDLSTEAGRKLWNSLLDLSDEFDTVQKLVDATAEATKAAAQAQGSLFDTWANDQQKLAAAQKLVTDTFAGLGKSVPATGADFLALAQSIDPATEAGQNMIAMLQKASDAFAYVQKSAATGAASMAQAAADAASTAANAWGSSADAIKSALDSLRIGQLAGLSPEAQYRAAKDRFSNLQQAAAGGDVDAASKLAQAATEFVQASRDYNGSSAAFAVDRAAAEAALANSLDYARSQLSVQQSIADASKAAVTQLQQLNGNLSALAQHYLDVASRKTIGTDLPSYDVGTAYVGTDQIAQIHRGEAVIDAQSMQVLRRYGIPAQPAVDNGMQQQLLDELRATRQVQQAGFAGMQQQLATANARLAAVEKRLDAVEQQARLSRAGA